jgi:hypothetical protein
MTYDEKIKHFEELQNEIVKLGQELDAKKQKYKAEFKATFGICDGEASNLLELVKAIRAVNLLQ